MLKKTMKKSMAVTAMTGALVAGALVTPGIAGTRDVTGSIELAPSTLRVADGSSALAFGGSATFDTSVSGRLAPRGYVYVSVVCWVDTGRVVYQWSAEPGFEFPLVDQAGQGLEWNGEAATCSSALIYRIDGQKPTIQTLDSAGFQVASS